MSKNINGICISGSTNNDVYQNTVSSNEYGIIFYGSSNNSIYHNNIISNVHQAYNVYQTERNVWDNGYPSGGNYWSDYTGIDANGDSVGDMPYIIDANNTDRYPLMGLAVSTVMSVVSPQSRNYTSSSVPFTFVADESFTSFHYSIDGRGNVTITGNLTLTGLSNGNHNVTLYGTRTQGGTEFSSAVSFSVNVASVPEFPSGLILPLLAAATLLSAQFYKKRIKP